ncbi:MAG: PQQ-binding-like beta-propeller repeat protein [Candidatus Solibacter usitatus]|nr:PQQ-binding-like beta-propeller repeat protein [Candidatus Solibacter usitatus]
MATSPILAGGNVVLAAEQVSGSFIAAFASTDGKLVWKQERASLLGGYSTPVTFEPRGGPAQVVVSSPLELAAYSAASGEKLWLTPDEFPDPAFREAVLAIDRVYGNGDGAIDAAEWNGALKLMQGLNALVAVRPGAGLGSHVRERWRLTRACRMCPRLFSTKAGYLVKDGCVVTALDPKTGEVLKQTRLRGALDKYFASPVAGDGKIYFTSEAGKIAVLRAGVDLELLAVNDLGEECFATPALANGGLYARTRQAL